MLAVLKRRQHFQAHEFRGTEVGIFEVHRLEALLEVFDGGSEVVPRLVIRSELFIEAEIDAV